MLDERQLIEELSEARVPVSLSVRAAAEAEEGAEVVRLYRATVATEAPVLRYDWDRDEVVDEVLTLGGMRAPQSVPLLDSHNRNSIDDVLGRVSGFSRGADGWEASPTFADTERGRNARQMVDDGTITDVSAGYSVIEKSYLEPGESATIDGRIYTAGKRAMVLGRQWQLKEVSMVPIGADVNARFRAAENLSSILAARAAKSNQEGAMSLDNTGGETPAITPAAVVDTLRADAQEITALCRLAGDIVTDSQRADWLEKAAADPGFNAATVRGEILKLRAATKRDDEITPRVISVGENNDLASLRAAAADAFLIRAGVVNEKGVYTRGGKKNAEPTKLHERALSLTEHSILGVGRMFLAASGKRGVESMSDKQVLQALSTRASGGSFNTQGDFATLLENTMNKFVTVGFNNAPNTWRFWAAELAANDLRQHNMYKNGGMTSLRPVNEAGEVPTIQRPDGKKEVLTPITFGAMFSITDEVIINDDLGAFAALTSEAGEAAATTVNEVAYYRLLNNAAVNEDSVAFFDNAHNNNATGSIAANGYIAQLNAMNSRLMKQRGLNGKPFNNRPLTKILVPPAIYYTLLELLNSTNVPGGTNETRNIYYQGFELEVDPLLELGATVHLTPSGAPLTAAGSATQFYAFNDRAPAYVGLFYGGTTPQIREERPIGILGTQREVVLRFNFGPNEWRVAQRHVGA
jgi:hypothetical protein